MIKTVQHVHVQDLKDFFFLIDLVCEIYCIQDVVRGLIEVKAKYKNPNANKYMLEKLLCIHLVKSCYAKVKMK